MVAKLSAEEGRFLNDQDEEGRARVAVIGRSTLESLTGDRHASVVGDSIQINRVSFTVVGVLKEKGAAAFGMDQDDMIVIPCSTAMRRVFSRTYLSEIGVSARSESDVDFATEEIANILRDRHKIRPPFADNDDFNVRSQAQIMDVMAQSSGTMTSLLGGIALVSLVVGGIGIMNIMLVSVTERTREIGVRKAVGATSNNILSQFLIEAVVISTLGGAIGIAAGAGVSKLLASMLQWDVLIQPSAVIAAVAVSATVGIFFGIYPARAAARLHPIQALRYE
jgi:putative ABC transport system permease protein